MPVNRRARAIAVGSVLALTVALFSLEYTVQRGDTLSEIARDHDVSLSDVIELNELSNADLIRPGQVILIPGVDGSLEQVHVVAQGESLSKIASIYGASASAIADANSMPNPDLIRPGQEILIPDNQEEVTRTRQRQRHRYRGRILTTGPVPHRSAWREPGLDCRAVLGRLARHHRRRKWDHQRKGLHGHPSLPRWSRLRRRQGVEDRRATSYRGVTV